MHVRNHTLSVFLSILLLVSLTSCASLGDLLNNEYVKVITTTIVESPILSEAAPGAALVAKSITALGSAFEEFSPENEYYIGRSVAGSILTHYTLADTPEMNRYLTVLANSLAVSCGSVPQPLKGYFVAVIDSPEINAFATPGGHIFITRGFIAAMENEDQLAAVIAHEISHVQLKHGLGAIKNSRNWEAVKSLSETGFYFAMEDKSRATEVLDTFESSVETVADTLLESGYSKNNEFDADKNAVYILSVAGYNFLEMENMLYLIDNPRFDETSGFGKTHPKPRDRIKELRNTYKELSSVPTDEVRTKRFKKQMAEL